MRNRSSGVAARDRPVISATYELRWDEAYRAFLLSSRDATIRLNESAAEILKRCDGAHSVATVVREVQALYADDHTRIESGVYVFLAVARGRGWVHVR